MEKKHILITGGAKGIGAASARLYAEKGHNVTILDLDEKAGLEISSELGDSCFFRICDISSSDEIKRSFSEAMDRFGDLDVLVNNAGATIYGTITETSEEQWNKIMGVNLTSQFLCAREAIPSMQRKGKGVVVLVSSVQAYISQANVAAYTTAKTAILGLTRSIAVDYSPQIRSVAICPGTIDTPMLHDAIQQSPDPQAVLQECHDMHLVKRIGKAEEVAELIVFVSTGNVDFMTGQAIRIDGGLGISVGGSKRDE